MNCEATREHLGAYFDGEVSPDLRHEIESHLVGCPGCAGELASIRDLAARLAPSELTATPDHLWDAIKHRLDRPGKAAPIDIGRLVMFRRYAIAAGFLIAALLGGRALLRYGDGASVARASTVDFGILLDALKHDATAAFEKFLSRYGAKEVSASEAKQMASQLNFDIPETLPGGFHLESAYTLRFGDGVGAAARYVRNGEFLGAVFHRPVQREDFGTHKDYECVIGKHRGHAVAVGDWKLVHLTDATTCHCVLSMLNEQTELPPVLGAVAPHFSTTETVPASHSHGHRP